MNLREALEKRAKEYAEKAHEGQTRKFINEPYFQHPKRVADIVKRFKSSHKIDELISAALLHDTIEDTNTTEQDLKKMFGGLVGSLVKELTSNKKDIKEKGKADYLADKMKSMSSWALVIKLADRLDNVSDLKNASPEFANKYSLETQRMLRLLKKERQLTNTQDKLVNAIYDKLNELEMHKFNEEFETRLKTGPKKQIEIFYNPTKKEMSAITSSNNSKMLRFIIDDKLHKIYVWTAEIWHARIAQKLKIPYQGNVSATLQNNYAFGMGLFNGNKIDIAYIFTGKKLKKRIKKRGFWANKWLTGFEAMDDQIDEETSVKIKKYWSNKYLERKNEIQKQAL